MDPIERFAQLRPDPAPPTPEERSLLHEKIFGKTQNQPPRQELAIATAKHSAPTSVDHRRRRRTAMLAATVVGIAGLAGGWAIASLRQPEPNQTVTGAPGATVDSTTPNPVVFEYVVSSRAGTERAVITEVDQDGVCYTILLESGDTQECVDASTISQGFAWSTYGPVDGPRFLAGVVPDEVDTVLVNGVAADRAGNVWSSDLPDTATIEVTVGDSTTDRWVTADLSKGGE